MVSANRRPTKKYYISNQVCDQKLIKLKWQVWGPEVTAALHPEGQGLGPTPWEARKLRVSPLSLLKKDKAPP